VRYLTERFPFVTSITRLYQSLDFCSTRHLTLFDKLVTAFPKLAYLRLCLIRLEEAYIIAEEALARLSTRKALKGPIGRLVLHCHPYIPWLDAVRDVEHVEVVW
jgi:hypothetical protein